MTVLPKLTRGLPSVSVSLAAALESKFVLHYQSARNWRLAGVHGHRKRPIGRRSSFNFLSFQFSCYLYRLETYTTKTWIFYQHLQCISFVNVTLKKDNKVSCFFCCNRSNYVSTATKIILQSSSPSFLKRKFIINGKEVHFLVAFLPILLQAFFVSV